MTVRLYDDNAALQFSPALRDMLSLERDLLPGRGLHEGYTKYNSKEVSRVSVSTATWLNHVLSVM